MYRDSETGLVFHRGFLTRSLFALRLIQAANLAFQLVYLLFALRFLLEYARVELTGPVGAYVQIGAHYMDMVIQPFRGIVPTGRDRAGHPLDWTIVVVAGAAALLHAWIVGVLRLLARARMPVED